MNLRIAHYKQAVKDNYAAFDAHAKGKAPLEDSLAAQEEVNQAYRNLTRRDFAEMGSPDSPEANDKSRRP